MEAKFVGLFTFISMVLAINGQTAVFLENLSDQEIESAIYYGDSNVNIGDSFTITCIVLISEPINWVKDGEPITKHNLRHWRDEHSYITSESPIDGEVHKIEAHISVRHALKVHQGRYKCNPLHSTYHMLKVHSIDKSFTRLHNIDSSEILSISTSLPESSYISSATDLFTIADPIHQGIGASPPPSPRPPPPPSSPNRSKDNLLLNGYSNATDFNAMYTIPDERPSPAVTWRGSSTHPDDRDRHRSLFDRNNITGVLLVHPSAFPIVNPEYIQMITGRMVEQPSSTESMTTRQFYLPVVPAMTVTPNMPITTATSTSTIKTTTTTTTTSATDSTTTLSKPIVKEPELLVPNYDNIPNRVKAFDIRQPLVLSCNITKEGEHELIWEKNGTDVTQVPSLQGRSRIVKAARQFIIEKTEETDAGTYSCRVNNEKKDFRVVANVVVRVPSNTGVVEGEKLSVHCVVVGTDPKLYWESGNLTMYNSTGRFVLKEDEKNIPNAVLTMDNVSLDDRGEYKCLARNINTDLEISEPASDVTYVRVKGKLAALWPFLGICAEVLILCTIILIYEKRRNKTELEESDTDPNTEQ